jgi:hypothetical protein
VADEHMNDFEEGARRALDWLGRSEDGAELATIVAEMPRRLGDMEVAFLIAIGRAALAGQKAAPQTETEDKTRHPAAVSTPDIPGVLEAAEFYRRVNAAQERQRQARRGELLRKNNELFAEQPMFGNSTGPEPGGRGRW